jgi:hypothetical protein
MMEINRNDLQEVDKGLLSIWEEFFSSPGWTLLKQRFEPRLEGTVSQMENADDMKALGKARGIRDTLLELLRLEQVIEHEFIAVSAVAQAERQDLEDSRGAMA